MQKSQALILVVIAAVFSAVVPQRALAFGDGCTKITEVKVDAEPMDDTHLADFSIYGNCLGSSRLRVFLAQGQMGEFRELTITAQDDHMIAAYLPSLDSEPELLGDYLLKLRTCSIWGCSDRAEWDLTIGAERMAPYVKRQCASRSWGLGDRNQFRLNCDGNGANADIAISGGCELTPASGPSAYLFHFLHQVEDNPAGVYNGYICGYRRPSDASLAPGNATITKDICTTVVCLPRNTGG